MPRGHRRVAPTPLPAWAGGHGALAPWGWQWGSRAVRGGWQRGWWGHMWWQRGAGSARTVAADVMHPDSRANEGPWAGGAGPAAPSPVNKQSQERR